jgi:hypothetical protein
MAQEKRIKTSAIERHIATQKAEEKREKRDHVMLTVFVIVFMGLLYFAFTGSSPSSKPDSAIAKDPTIKKEAPTAKKMEH